MPKKFWLKLTLLFFCGRLLAAQTIPQAMFENGWPQKLKEIPSAEGSLLVEWVVRGLNQPRSAVWVPLRSVSTGYTMPYSVSAPPLSAPFSSGGAWLISEEKGGLWVLYQEVLYPLRGLPQDVVQLGAGGFFDLLYNPWVGLIFLSYAKQINATLSTVSVVSFHLRYKPEQFLAGNVQEVFRAIPPLRRPLGYGGSLSATQEFLYVGLGGGNHPLGDGAERVQDWGSVIKIGLREKQFFRADSLPTAGNSSTPSVSRVSTGHGDIYDLSWDPERKFLWSVEQLRQVDATVVSDELNWVREGAHYGWGGGEGR
ncbi:MAG: PQQ-dependent sugar dehydrogenase, partial [Spirochaetota bacterium]